MSQTINRTGAFHEQLTHYNAGIELFVYMIVWVITVTYSQLKIDGGTQ